MTLPLFLTRHFDQAWDRLGFAGVWQHGPWCIGGHGLRHRNRRLIILVRHCTYHFDNVLLQNGYAYFPGWQYVFAPTRWPGNWNHSRLFRPLVITTAQIGGIWAWISMSCH